MNSKVRASFSPYRPGFDSQLFRVKFVANKEALGQVSSPSTLVFITAIIITPAVLHIHLSPTMYKLLSWQ